MPKSLSNNRKERARRSPKRKGAEQQPQQEEFARDNHQRDNAVLEPLTEAQALYINSIRTNALTFGIGPAGTGKSFIAASLAASALLEQEVDRIIISRPVVEAGERLGFLPGDLMEKFGPYLAPLRSILDRRLGKGAVEMFLKNGRLVAMPLAFMRGHTFEHAFVILDEAQNTTPTQMKLFLSRLGQDCRVVVDGDPRQQDIPGPSGLMDAVRRLDGLRGVNVVQFTRADIVRSGLVQDIIERYEPDMALDNAGVPRFLSGGA